MLFDADAGLYVFEVTLGFKESGERQASPPFLIQADDADEAEEKVMEFLASLDLKGSLWVEELSEPHPVEDYEQEMDESEGGSYPMLDELNEEELRDYLDL